MAPDIARWVIFHMINQVSVPQSLSFMVFFLGFGNFSGAMVFSGVHEGLGWDSRSPRNNPKRCQASWGTTQVITTIPGDSSRVLFIIRLLEVKISILTHIFQMGG